MNLKSIHEIFTNRILRIPSYQRGYSWANNRPVDLTSKDPLKNVKGQLKDLWDDLLNIPEGKWHYTGLLTLVEVKKKDYEWLPNFKQYAIVDGQQRITSILILLSVIIDRAKKQDITLGIREGDVEIQYLYIKRNGVYAYIFGYERDNPSDKFFRKHILNLNEVEDDSEESTYTENLLKAKAFFEAMVELYLKDNENSIEGLFNKVTSQLKLNEYVLPEELDEYVVFETMNNRGKPLSQLEKLKNRLLYLNDKFEVEPTATSHEITLNEARKKQLGESINKAWITIYKSLGQNKDRPLSDEEFIKNHWILYFDEYNRDEANVYANFLFDEYFNLQSVYDRRLTIEMVENYIRSLQKCSIWWNKLNNPEYFNLEHKKIKGAILRIHQVGLKASFKPILLAILTRKDRSDFIETIQALEKYSFKLFDIANKRGNTGDSKIYSLAYNVYANIKAPDDTNEEVLKYTAEYYRFNLFVNQSYEMFEFKQGFYKWSGRHYLLFMYDKYLRSQNFTTSHSSELMWKEFKKNDSIEHIFPQSATISLEQYATNKSKSIEDVKTSYNRIQNNWNSFKDYNPKERKRLANSLGNLLAISQSDNSSFSNDPFKFKVDQSNKGKGYPNRGYAYDSMSARVVANEKEWTPNHILNRGLDILKFLCDYIGEPFDEIDELTKYKVLGLEFMYDHKIEDAPKIEEELNQEIS
jgi:uncharacterized protein with ParB-like and HNH nuclease domain